jgi:hypothetical protein
MKGIRRFCSTECSGISRFPDSRFRDLVFNREVTKSHNHEILTKNPGEGARLHGGLLKYHGTVAIPLTAHCGGGDPLRSN